MNGRDFLDCARRYSIASAEGDWRTAVSRAYYAVFHHFRDWLLSKNGRLGSGWQSHSSLYLGLANCGIASNRVIADRIDELRKSRTYADCDLWRKVTATTASRAVDDADAIFADFQTALQATPAQQIADGARNYLIAIGRIMP